MFSPMPDNEYLHVPTGNEAEEIAMEEIVVSSTATASGLRNVKSQTNKSET